ncbi:MAG TPA: 3-deoxy-7-phosphoheptulonate synthase [Verrucomicrobiales bacterium]|nr:3-deoxy-7-phosphoheptulonate synthase [Verrucomicrobiales bacterium]
MTRTDDLRIDQIHSLISPAVLMEEVEAEESHRRFVADSRRSVEAIVQGEDDRLLVVSGPCSIHDAGAALEYAGRLAGIAGRCRDDLFLVMRVYFEKPRTTVGWKGYINDPGLDQSFDINRGLRQARRLLLDLATNRVPAGTEFLDTISPQYIADLVTWGAIGARTTESQVHRELASGLSMAVGFKNGTDGNIRIAIDAIEAARHPHSFLSVTKQGVSAIVRTRGNECCHVILRGSSHGTNYDAASAASVGNALQRAGLKPRLMVDCSHGNSRKDPVQQAIVARDVASQIREGSPRICGVMLESHLCEGRQEIKPDADPVYGMSITDACLGWEATEEILLRFAEASRTRRLAAALSPSS